MNIGDLIEIIDDGDSNSNSGIENKIRQQVALALKISNIGDLQNIHEREKYANRIFILICIFLGFSLLIVILSGITICPCGLKYLNLSDAVLITILTTTTANVLGLMIIVINYLFPKNK